MVVSGRRSMVMRYGGFEDDGDGTFGEAVTDILTEHRSKAT